MCSFWLTYCMKVSPQLSWHSHSSLQRRRVIGYNQSVMCQRQTWLPPWCPASVFSSVDLQKTSPVLQQGYWSHLRLRETMTNIGFNNASKLGHHLFYSNATSHWSKRQLLVIFSLESGENMVFTYTHIIILSLIFHSLSYVNDSVNTCIFINEITWTLTLLSCVTTSSHILFHMKYSSNSLPSSNFCSSAVWIRSQPTQFLLSHILSLKACFCLIQQIA